MLIGYLLVRSFMRMGEESQQSEQKREKPESKPAHKKIPKEIGEYVDYEEMKK